MKKTLKKRTTNNNLHDNVNNDFDEEEKGKYYELGFEYGGYDRNGYDPWGYDRNGYDRNGNRRKCKKEIYEAINSFLQADNLDKLEKKDLSNKLKILNENYIEYDYYGLNPLYEDYYKYFRIVADYIEIILERNGFKSISYCDKDDNIVAYHMGVYIYEKNNLIICIKDKYKIHNCEICKKSTINIIIDKYMTKKEMDEYLKNL